MLLDETSQFEKVSHTHNQSNMTLWWRRQEGTVKVRGLAGNRNQWV